jgi:hypothetical protein
MYLSAPSKIAILAVPVEEPSQTCRVVSCVALMLHELMRARTRLVRVLAHSLVSRIHRAHCLVLLNRRTVHRTAALGVMKLGRGVHW